MLGRRNSPTMSTSVLLIDANPAHQAAIRQLAQTQTLEWVLSVAVSQAQALEMLVTPAFDVVLCAHQLPDGTAFGLFEQVRQTPVIAMRPSCAANRPIPSGCPWP